MTTEAMGAPSATMSHPWGTGAIAGVVHGLAGLAQRAPAWSAFTVAPRLATLDYLNVTVPTIRGAIAINAVRAPPRLEVAVPCNTRALLCLQRAPPPRAPHGPRVAAAAPPPPPPLRLDGAIVDATVTPHHVCATRLVVCGAHPRVLSY